MSNILREVVGYEGLYSVDAKGNVYSHKRNKFLKPFLTKPQKYLKVHLYDNDGKVKTIPIHNIVCTAFNGVKPSPKHEVNHKDANRYNNCFENLEWMTRSENVKHTYVTTRIRPSLLRQLNN